MSEVRAPGGMLIVSGCLVALGAFRRGLTGAALALAALLYGTYGVSRLISIAFDGLPSAALISATAFELVVGATALIALVRTGLRPT